MEDSQEMVPFRNVYVTFGEWVMLMRKRKNLTQRDVAARYSIDISLVSKLENDLYLPSPAIRRDLCEFLGDVDIVP